ncbi:MAG: hypothetical protein EHM46_04180, partial [Bacteroidetes bacterium]
MSQQNQSETQHPHGAQTGLINIRRLVLVIAGKWYYFAGSLAIAMVMLFLYLKYSLPTYLVTSTLLVDQGENSSLPGLDNNLIEGFRITPGQANLDNQILILTSYSLIKETIGSLPFETVVYRRGLRSAVSYYPLEPIRIMKDEGGHFPLDNEFVFQYLSDDQFRLYTSRRAEYKMDNVVRFGQKISLNGGSFTIYPQPELEDVYKSGNRIYFKFSDLDKMTRSFRDRLNVVAASRDGTILRNSLIGTNPVRDIVFLDRLIEMSMLKNLEKKNHEAQHII